MKSNFIFRYFCRLLVLFLLPGLTGGNVFGQPSPLPNWASDSLKSKALDKRYAVDTRFSPSFLQADLDGDGYTDLAALIVEKATGKKGIIVILGKFREYYVLGAGNILGNGGDDFKWMGRQKIYLYVFQGDLIYDSAAGHYQVCGNKVFVTFDHYSTIPLSFIIARKTTTETCFDPCAKRSYKVKQREKAVQEVEAETVV